MKKADFAAEPRIVNLSFALDKLYAAMVHIARHVVVDVLIMGSEPSHGTFLFS